jgi:hypothetical protein
MEFECMATRRMVIGESLADGDLFMGPCGNLFTCWKPGWWEAWRWAWWVLWHSWHDASKIVDLTPGEESVVRCFNFPRTDEDVKLLLYICSNDISDEKANELWNRIVNEYKRRTGEG